MATVNIQLECGDWEEAAAGYKEIIRLNPKNVWAYFGLNDVYQANFETERPTVAYKKAVAIARGHSSENSCSLVFSHGVPKLELPKCHNRF